MIDASFLAPDCIRSSPSVAFLTKAGGGGRIIRRLPLPVATCKKLHKRVACRRARLVFTRRGGSASSADSVRQIHAVRAHWPRRHGRRVQGTRPGTRRVRTRLRRQAHPAAPVRRPPVHAHVHRGGQALGPPQPPQHRAGVRAGGGRQGVLHRDGVREGARPGRDHAHPLGARRPAAPRAGGLRRARDVPRPGLRPRSHRRRRRAARHDPPRRLPLERDAVVRGRRQAARLRHRQGAGRRVHGRRGRHPARHPQGQVRVHGARADRRATTSTPHRHLRLRHRPARGPDRPPPVQGRKRSPDRRARAPVRGGAPLGAQPPVPARARRHHPAGAGPQPRRALPDQLGDGRRPRRRGPRRPLPAHPPGAC